MEMKHQDGYTPSAEDTAKLNEFITWLAERGYEGIVMIHKGEIGVSWLHEGSADDVRHTLINSMGHIYDADPNAMWECIAAVGAKLSKEGNMYCFLYGDNIQEGVCGFGETIFKAAWDFYTNVKTQEA